MKTSASKHSIVPETRDEVRSARDRLAFKVAAVVRSQAIRLENSLDNVVAFLPNDIAAVASRKDAIQDINRIRRHLDMIEEYLKNPKKVSPGS